MLLEVSKPVELFVSPSWIDPDPDPDTGKSISRWKLTCIKYWPCLRYHVTHFPGTILYHDQTVIPACDKAAEAWRCDVSCSRWHSKEVVESEFEPGACTVNHSVYITSLPRGTPQQTQLLFLPISGQSQPSRSCSEGSVLGKAPAPQVSSVTMGLVMLEDAQGREEASPRSLVSWLLRDCLEVPLAYRELFVFTIV